LESSPTIIFTTPSAIGSKVPVCEVGKFNFSETLLAIIEEDVPIFFQKGKINVFIEDYYMTKLNILDIGTGDGRFIYKSAALNPKNIYIGIEPSVNFKEYQREINRKKLTNATLINSSVENFDSSDNFFDQIFIHLPWGVLLKYVVTVDKDIFKKLSKMLKKGGELEIIFGYDPKLEHSETKRLELKELNLNELGFLKERYSKIPGLELKHFQLISNKDLKNKQTSWSKKLAFGGLRNFFQINLVKK